MKFPALFPGTLVKRYKRFLADVRLEDGELVTAHCPNSGSMLGCKEPGSAVYLSKSDNPNRKLQYTWEMIRVGKAWVGINTARPNALVEEAIREGTIPELSDFETLRREVPYGKNSRIDILLESKGGKRRCYVEVKNTTLAMPGGIVRFPDAVTERGQKHLEELMAAARKGDQAVIFFFVNRSDCDRMGPADHIDPEYGKLLRRAADSGVELLAYRAKVSPKETRLETRLPIDLSEYK
ncbi:MAG: DNA/RNA nuclease SfsA [Bdellovibrionota bacterium]